jgi:hypothetical protein
MHGEFKLLNELFWNEKMMMAKHEHDNVFWDNYKEKTSSME